MGLFGSTDSDLSPLPGNHPSPSGERWYLERMQQAGRRYPLGDIELAFRKAWLFLYARGVGPDYIAALEAFVRATIAAYRQGLSLDRLKLELIANRKLTGNTALDANLAFDPEELGVRDLWLRLIYLTLELAGEALPGEPLASPEPSADETGVEMLVEGVIRAHRDGYTLDSFKFELAFEGRQIEDPEQAALFSQWLRIIFMCLQLRAEDNLEADDQNA